MSGVEGRVRGKEHNEGFGEFSSHHVTRNDKFQKLSSLDRFLKQASRRSVKYEAAESSLNLCILVYLVIFDSE